MKFKIIDKETNKEPTTNVITDIAKRNNLIESHIDQFAITEDENIILLDNCGNSCYCNINKLKVEYYDTNYNLGYNDGFINGLMSNKEKTFDELLSNIKELQNRIPKKIIKDALEEIYYEGVNMTGKYQGCWIRFKDVERIINKYINK